MKGRKIVSLIVGFVVSLLIFAGIPTVSAFCPGPIAGEVAVAGANFSFSYGHNAMYGAYLRDIQWNSPTNGWDRYYGMLTIPWFRINGVRYFPPGGGFGGGAPVCVAGGGGAPDFTVTWTYTFTIGPPPNNLHMVTYQVTLWHLPPFAPTGTEAVIDITATHSVTFVAGGGGGPWTFDFAVRNDFDIAGLTVVPTTDLAYTHAGVWLLQPVEITFTTIAPGDPLYFMDVFQEDNRWTVGAPVPATGPWAGIVGPKFGPLNPENYHLVLYVAGQNRGLPVGYVNGQGIANADIVIWHETGWVINNPAGIPGPPGTVTSVSITSRV